MIEESLTVTPAGTSTDPSTPTSTRPARLLHYKTYGEASTAIAREKQLNRLEAGEKIAVEQFKH